MPNPFFSFKQFTIYHDLCAMKVGTDGVLLGAWTNCIQANRILDVGSGSGLISLMLAQRCPNARIDAIDIDDKAFEQTKINFSNSRFEKQLKAFHKNFLLYEPEYSYDLIVSNPPYFNDSLNSPDKARTIARHTSSLNMESLILHAFKLLQPSGRLAFILPYSSFNFLQTITCSNNLFLARKTLVRTLQNSPPKRILLEYTKKECSPTEDELFIELSRHNYSEEYKELTKDFYL